MEKNRRKRIKQDVIERDGSLCCFCEKVLQNNEITLDHIVPESRRGTFNATNLTVSCGPCNNKRGSQSFFEFCKKFNFSQDKLDKYKLLYRNNLRIKILNLAKEFYLKEEMAIPNKLIKQACQHLKIQNISYIEYEKMYDLGMKFSELCERKKIKYAFELLIRIIESDI